MAPAHMLHNQCSCLAKNNHHHHPSRQHHCRYSHQHTGGADPATTTMTGTTTPPLFVQADHAEPAKQQLTPPMSGGHHPNAALDAAAAGAADARLRLRRRVPPGAVVAARLRDVRHLPAPFDPSQPRQTLPFLCESFYATGLCPAAGACADVHVDPGRVLAMAAHVRMLQPQPEPERLGPAGHALLVAPAYGAPRGTGGSKLLSVDANHCLPTRALRTTRPRRASHDGDATATGGGGNRALPTLRLCTHFAGDKGVCDYGLECRFVHWLGPNHAEPAANTGVADCADVTTPTHGCDEGTPDAVDVAREQNTRYRHQPYGIGAAGPGWTRRRDSPPPSLA